MAITAPPSIDALPSPPDPNDRSTFNTRAYPWSAAQQTLASQLGAVASNVFNNATEAATAATTANTQAGIATTAASTATTQAGVATAAAISLADQADIATTQAGIATTQAGIATTKAAEAAASAASISSGPVTSVNAKTGVVTLNAADIGLATASQGEMEAGTETALRAMSPLRVAQAIAAIGKGKITRSARTSNTALAADDIGKLIDITSGTFTQTFNACSTLGSGWFVYLRNGGTGDITIDPNASETIDGLTSYVMYPGEVRLIQCDGTALRTIVLNAFYKVFDTSGTFINPPGYALVEGMAWGGGASGSRNTVLGGGGGGGAAGCPFRFVTASLASSVSVTIGSGGNPVTGANSGGLAGGSTTFGSLLTAPGAPAPTGATNGGSGGSVVDGVVGWAGPTGGAGAGSASVYAGGAGAGENSGSAANGGSSIYGAGGGGNGVATPGNGGTSVVAGAGGAGGNAVNGSPGSAPGGGGGGTRTGTQSGAGARGELRIWGVI